MRCMTIFVWLHNCLIGPTSLEGVWKNLKRDKPCAPQHFHSQFITMRMVILLAFLIHAVCRVSGCVNESFVSTAGTSYNIYCDTDWPFNDLNHIALTDLTTCIDFCDSWNHQQVPTLCIGVSFVLPGQTNAGCWLKSVMAGPGIKNVYIVDSAKRNNNVASVLPQRGR